MDICQYIEERLSSEKNLLEDGLAEKVPLQYFSWYKNFEYTQEFKN